MKPSPDKPASDKPSSDKPSPDPGAAPAPQPIEPMPPTLSSMWRLCKLGFRYERGLMVASLAISQVASLPSALTALWVAMLGAGVVAGDARLALGAGAA